MLDMAHSIFNAVTGVTLRDETREIRAFRSILEWRDIISSVGFVDTMLYEMQEDDPTLDIMMCFYKPPLHTSFKRPEVVEVTSVPLPLPPPIIPAITSLMQNVPATVLDMFKNILENVIKSLPSISKMILEMIHSSTSSGLSNVLQQAIERYTKEITTWLERFRPFLESTTSVDMDFVPPELLLIIPALNKRVQRGVASPLEMAAAGIIQDIKSAFVMETKEPIKQFTNKQTGFQREQVFKQFNLLLDAVPALKEVTILDTIKVPTLAHRFLKSFWITSSSIGESKLKPAVDWVMQNLDQQAWIQLESALEDIIKTKTMPPSWKKIVACAAGKKKNHREAAVLWAKALSAVLGSPLVYFTTTIAFQLKLLGLAGIDEAWSRAQEARGSQPSPSFDFQLEASELIVEMEENAFFDIENVSQIVQATYGYSSLTSSPVDVTDYISRKFMHNKLYLKDMHKQELQQFRDIVPGWDSLRKAVRGKVSKLTIRYYPIVETDPQYKKKIEQLLFQLSESGWVKPLHRNDGHFTWFKLPEWLQVEITQIFANSMDHTPWYRFPFMKFIGLYFDVLFKEMKIVQSEYGFAKALLSNAFLTDIIPGIVMFFLFGQLQLLALPVKSVAGSEYANPELMIEQVVILLPRETQIDWKRIDDRIQAQCVSPKNGLYVLAVPTFKPLTEIILKIANYYPIAQILEISNQQTIQVKAVVPASERQEAKIAMLKNLNGCTVMFSYQFPVDGKPTSNNYVPPLCLSLKVETLALVRLICLCKDLEISVHQIYDFYT